MIDNKTLAALRALTPGGTGGGGAQPDWNANEGEAGHILNRTHWTASGADVILAEQTVTFGSDGMGAISGTLDIEAGKTYTVIWDGAEYICDCKTGYYNGLLILYIGNPIIVGGANNQIPFIFGKVVANGYALAACLTPNSSHSFAILSAPVHKIPERYMGDNDFVIHFEGTPDTENGLIVKETADEIIAAIDVGKNVVGKLTEAGAGSSSATAVMKNSCVCCVSLGSEGVNYVITFSGAYGLPMAQYNFVITLYKSASGTECGFVDIETDKFTTETSYQHH